MSTITVHHRYVVQPGEVLTFHNELAFYIDPGKNHTDVQLVNAGEVRVTEDAYRSSSVGIDTAVGTGTVSFLNKAGATFAVSATGPNSYATAAAFHLAGSATNKGEIDVFADHGDAFGIISSSAHLDLTNDGVLNVEGSSAYAVDLHAPGDIVNSGRVSAISDGHYDYARAVLLGAGGSLTNEGLIEATSRGLSDGVDMTHGVGSLYNSGKIIASTTVDEEDCTAVAINGSTVGTHVTIDNSGQIICKQPGSFPTALSISSSSVDGVYTDLFNSGKIVGDIRAGSGALQLHDMGAVQGDIYLGPDNDLIQISGHGSVDGVIRTGDGDDTVLGGRGAEVIFSDETFQQVEQAGRDLVSGGGGDDVIAGGGNADTLIGGSGGDTLTGGKGHDHFIFQAVGDSHGDHTDLVTDLGAHDLIDLSMIDADRHTAGDQAFILVDHLEGHAGQAALSYDAGTNETSLQLDVNGDGVADAIVRLTGDQTGFSNFAL